MTRSYGGRSAPNPDAVSVHVVASRPDLRRAKSIVSVGMLCTLLAGPGQALGQDLSVAEQLVAAGRTAEARQMVDSWWDAYGETAQAGPVQRALWLRGRLTLDPDLAAVDYERLVDEFRGGPYSDDALLRLALAAEVGGDLDGATERFQALAQDYPTRPAGIEAAQWIESHPAVVAAGVESEESGRTTVDDPTGEPDEQPEMPSAPVPDPEGTTPDVQAADPPAQPVVDLEPQVEAPPVGTVVGAVAVAQPASIDEEASAAAPPPVDVPIQSASPGQTYTVEVGAYLSRPRADRIVERLDEHGHEARIVKVPGSPLFRVRVGLFDDLAEAEPLLAALADEQFSASVVEDVDLEQAVTG